MTMTAGTAVPLVQSELSLYRLHLMRAGYLLMGVGLAVVTWPLLPGASDLPLFEGVTQARQDHRADFREGQRHRPGPIGIGTPANSFEI